jgi:anion-transporting  ArsA/GET3 family ATPase
VTIEELFRRRLLFTVGKGGVGRTTTTLAIGLEAARRGLRVLLVELEGGHGLEHALTAQRSAPSPPPGIERIDHLVVDGRRALEEYLALVIPVRRLLRTIFSSKVYQYFVAAAPGLRELMAVGKIWYEAQRARPDPETNAEGGERPPDIVLVDGPATGHSLQYLRMPRAAAEAFPVGLVHREAERVQALLVDPKATAVVIATTAEEMPANETSEIYASLRALGLPTALLVVNQVHSAPVSAEELAALEGALPRAAGGSPGSLPSRRARKPPGGVEEPDGALFAEVLARAQEEAGWAAINGENIERLRMSVPLPTVRLPFLFAEEFGAEDVVRLSQILASQMSAATTGAKRGGRSSRRGGRAGDAT